MLQTQHFGNYSINKPSIKQGQQAITALCEQNHSHEVLKHLRSNKFPQFLCKDHSVCAGKLEVYLEAPFCKAEVVFKFVGNFLDAREDKLGIPIWVGIRKSREDSST